MSTNATGVVLPTEDVLCDVQMDIVSAVHRHTGFIPFAARNDEGEWGNVCSVRSHNLNEGLPWLRNRLAKDSYVGINADRSAKQCRGSEWPLPAHDTRNLAFLCANYCDVDYEREGLTFGQASGMIVDYERTGVIPPASLVGDSGRGLWLLWLLRDPGVRDSAHVLGDGPKRAHALQLYTATQECIVHKLSSIGADPCGTDPARWWRLPGSFRTDVERYVRYWPRFDQNGKPFIYTQQELTALLDVTPRTRAEQRKSPLDAERVVPEWRKVAWRSLQRPRLADVEALIHMRGGGFPKGCRHHGALVLALALKQNGYQRAKVAERVHEFGRRCNPPMRRAEVDSAVRSVYKREAKYAVCEREKDALISTLKDHTIAKWLRITRHEAKHLQRLRCPEDYEPVSVASTREPRTESDRDARRRIVRQVAHESLTLPSTREMVALLRTSGIQVTHVTVAADYRALGLCTDEPIKPEGLRTTSPDQKQPKE